jgi:hypothetical protein
LESPKDAVQRLYQRVHRTLCDAQAAAVKNRKEFALTDQLAIPVVFTALAIAQISDDEYKTLMQSIGANVTAIRNSADTAAAAPARLRSLKG